MLTKPMQLSIMERPDQNVYNMEIAFTNDVGYILLEKPNWLNLIELSPRTENTKFKFLNKLKMFSIGCNDLLLCKQTL